MLYTATILMCLIGAPQDYKKCEVVNLNFKFASETDCQQAVMFRVTDLYEQTRLMDKYEIIDMKCTNWLQK